MNRTKAEKIIADNNAATELPFKMVRTEKAGVWFGYLLSPEGPDVVMVMCRNVWYWEGAASLSQLAAKGTSKPKGCKFPAVVLRNHLFGVIGIFDVTPEAKKNLESVSVWEL